MTDETNDIATLYLISIAQTRILARLTDALTTDPNVSEDTRNAAASSVELFDEILAKLKDMAGEPADE